MLFPTDDLGSQSDDESDNEGGYSSEDEQDFRNEMDSDGDGKLNREEIYRWLVPDDFDHIVDESNHLFTEADDDKVCNICLAAELFKFQCLYFFIYASRLVTIS